MYVEAWEKLRNDINLDLNRIQNGDINELSVFQKNTREWVRGVNQEFELAQLKKKGRLSISDNFFDDNVVKTQKDFVENPTFEAFKTEVRKNISSQNAKLEELCAKQEAIGADLKLILSLLQNRNP
ncbi:hypothetical protein A2U01_0040010 [Trifolium medium]|uniref:Uncharacterized protein n=1 Tax=Trifolium medium TaxID=97028 RepID=A0A392Q6H2_9FABA|nr:hypothetical protein [Trifolium medium]